MSQIFRARAQDHDFLRRQSRGDDEPVEFVILDITAENLSECSLEYLVQRFDLDFCVGRRRQHAQVVHPDRFHALGRNTMRTLVEHFETHMLQHGQTIGQGPRRTEMIELEAKHPRRCFERAIQRHGQRLRGSQPRHQCDVGNRSACRKILPVSCGKCASESLEQFVASRLTGRIDERGLQIVFLTPGNCGQARLEHAHVESGNLA